MIVSEANGLKSMIQKDEAYVLIDLRNKKSAFNGFIKGAVSIPLAELNSAKAMFPADKSAPIILYEEGQASEKAFRIIRSWGYKNTSLLNGGIKGWDGKIFSGKPGNQIVYEKKLKAGELGIDEFKKIVAEKPTDKIILDVRDSNAAGKITGALNIPQSQLASRLGELPRDKELIIHCNTGILAGMSNNILKEKGFKTRFLDAVVQVSPNGTFEISEK